MEQINEKEYEKNLMKKIKKGTGLTDEDIFYIQDNPKSDLYIALEKLAERLNKEKLAYAKKHGIDPDSFDYIDENGDAVKEIDMAEFVSSINQSINAR